MSVPQGLGFPLMAGSRGNEEDTALCLSDLPNAILLHILSFLPTKSVVATSLLSRRWQKLWTSTPNLQLDEYLFSRRSEFINFAERALLVRGGSSLVSFSLSCSVRNDESCINTWISSAVRCNVEQLSLSLDLREYDGPSLFLPCCMFGCHSLVKLDLCIGLNQPSTIIRVPSLICLPRLKHLKLTQVEFADNESTENLLSHPLLEELILCDCVWFNVTTVNVNSPKLQSLTIEADHEDEDDWSAEQQICFFGDNLKFFSYKGDRLPTHYCICGSTLQLSKAKILVDIPSHEFPGMDGPSNRYCKLVNSLSMVQNLTLSDAAVDSLHRLSQCPRLQTTFPVFERVTRLNLSAYYNRTTMHIDYVWLRMILKRCPHLEHLNFMQGVPFNSSTRDLPLLRPMPLCFLTHLKKITIQRYDPKCKEQAEAIHVLLYSAPVLEEMVLHCKRDGRISGEDSMVELEREFNTRPKVSENCRVSIVLL